MSLQNKVREFHEAFGAYIAPSLGEVGDDIRKLRIRLMNEEVNEYLIGEENNDIENMAKELADILYIAFGTAVSYGIPLEDVFEEVHRSNMSKLGNDGKPVYREDGKVLKGPNFSPADIAHVFSKAQGLA